ncbi:hypothetical protein D9M68_957980 [compost metagenome]
MQNSFGDGFGDAVDIVKAENFRELLNKGQLIIFQFDHPAQADVLQVELPKNF